jgi:hypothetical protein
MLVLISGLLLPRRPRVRRPHSNSRNALTGHPDPAQDGADAHRVTSLIRGGRRRPRLSSAGLPFPSLLGEAIAFRPAVEGASWTSRR